MIKVPNQGNCIFLKEKSRQKAIEYKSILWTGRLLVDNDKNAGTTFLLSHEDMSLPLKDNIL